MTVIDFNIRIQARQMYWSGYSVAQISKTLILAYHTVDSWKRREEWDLASAALRIEGAVDIRLNKLLAKEIKDDSDFKEIEVLTRTLERTARIRRYEGGGNESDLNPNVKNRNKGRKKKQSNKNFLSEDDIEKLIDTFKETLFEYQKHWYRIKDDYRIRNLLKSRQIGATWYFAREALIDAIQTGDNQIFLSASKAQSHVFKYYILAFVKDVAGVELKGDPITLWNGATLYFLSTNSRTAQSYHGHLYLDEYFWIGRFQQLRKVASGMAMHKKWRQTYFSTPSTLNHEGYPFWSGGQFNKGRKKEDQVEFDISHSALQSGLLCPDGQYRQIVTVEDAVRGGCDLFDLPQLQLEYNDSEYENLLMCKFVDDAASVFKLKDLQSCMVDSWVIWDDFKPLTARPFGNREVWLGYDPSRSRDDACLIVMAPPRVPGGKFRILEKHSLSDQDFDRQAALIKKTCRRYNVTYMGIDVSGIGLAVYELVKKFFPAVTKITYSVEVKTRMVLKAMQHFSHGRIEFDAGWTDLALAFMTIHKTNTTSGRHMTYQASRTSETGHADIAWAVMHALDKQQLTSIDQTGQGTGSFMEICT